MHQTEVATRRMTEELVVVHSDNLECGNREGIFSSH